MWKDDPVNATTESMKLSLKEAKAGNIKHLEKIRFYLRYEVFPLLGGEIDREGILSSDERTLNTMAVIVRKIEDAHAGDDGSSKPRRISRPSP